MRQFDSGHIGHVNSTETIVDRGAIGHSPANAIHDPGSTVAVATQA